MTAEFYLQRADKEIFEEVDGFVYDNFANVVMADGQPRYNGNRIKRENGSLTLNLQGVDPRTLTFLARFGGVKETDLRSLSGGGFICPCPVEIVEVQQKSKHFLYDVRTGEQWVKRRKTPAPVAIAA